MIIKSIAPYILSVWFFIIRRPIKMFSNTNKKVKQLLDNLDPQMMEKGFKAVSRLMETEEGKRIAEQIKSLDKEKLINELTNDPSLVEKLRSYVNKEN